MSFFQGTLQEGIAAAIRDSKSVVCFVTDNETESKQWEDEYLTDDEVVPLLQTEAVTLRLVAGSQEEGFLSQLYPLPKKPTLVVIKNGELKEYIVSGASKEDLIRRLTRVLKPTPPPTEPAAVSAPQPPPEAQNITDSSSTSSGRATPPENHQAQVDAMLADRAARLAAQKKKDEEEARKRRIEKGKAKAENPDAQSKHADTLKKKQREAREERQRILKAIEDDKKARREAQERREAERRAAAAAAADGGANPQAADVPFAPASPLYPKSGRISEHCALQVRLLNGSTIRSKFLSKDTLKDVRQWVDDTTNGDVGGSGKGYTFKILLTPLPNRTVDVTEEGNTLQELGLTPSATLILIPVTKSVHAYASGGGSGSLLLSPFTLLLAIFNGFMRALIMFFSTMFSTAPPPTGPSQPAGADQRGQGIASGRDAAARRNDQQFYNGNSTNFEPRPEDEDTE